MGNPLAFNMSSAIADTQNNKVSGCASPSYSLSYDKFSDSSWLPVDGDAALGPAAAATSQGFSTGLCSQQYDMSLQPYCIMPFDTLAPAELETAMSDDAASYSVQSWPDSPISLLATFSDVSTASTHTSPDDLGTEPSSLRRHNYHQPPQSKSKPQAARSKRRGCESDGNSLATSKSQKIDPQSRNTTITTTTASGARSRKRKIREKNRTAATKYRNKTKKGIKELQAAEALLFKKNSVLRAHVEFLHNEILSLKTEVLRHGTCDSLLITEYIIKTAKRLC